MNKSLENNFYDLLSAKLSGGASATQLEQLQLLLLQNPEFQILYDALLRPIDPECDESITELSYASQNAKMYIATDYTEADYTPPNAYISKKLKWYYTLAAACIFSICVLTIIYYRPGKTIAAYAGSKNTMAIPKGSKSKITLPDGTIVHLNAASTLVYDEQFVQKNREVMLVGEAYFDVAHDSAHPFIIHTGKFSVKVLGTTFNIKAYSNSFFETSLIKGRVEITPNNAPDIKTILKPSHKFVYYDTAIHNVGKTTVHAPGGAILPITVKDSLIAEISWVNNKMVFVNTTLEEIVQDLEKRFDIKATFKTSQPRYYRYTGVFDDYNLEEILQIIKLSKNINYKIRNKELIIE